MWFRRKKGQVQARTGASDGSELIENMQEPVDRYYDEMFDALADRIGHKLAPDSPGMDKYRDCRVAMYFIDPDPGFHVYEFGRREWKDFVESRPGGLSSRERREFEATMDEMIRKKESTEGRKTGYMAAFDRLDRFLKSQGKK